MSCIKCGSNEVKDMHIKLKMDDGSHQEVYKCKFCGYLFQDYKPEYIPFSNRGRQGVPCEVIQILDDEEIARYESMAEASKQTGISWCSIQKCVAGDSNSAGGYRWKRA